MAALHNYTANKTYDYVKNRTLKSTSFVKNHLGIPGGFFPPMDKKYISLDIERVWHIHHWHFLEGFDKRCKTSFFLAPYLLGTTHDIHREYKKILEDHLL